MLIRHVCLLTIFFWIFSDLHAQIVVPGEWESQESVWVPYLGQSHLGTDDSITIPIIKKLSAHVTTVIVVEDDSLYHLGKSFFARFEVDTSNISLVKISPISMWLRDIAPVFCYPDRNREVLEICDFKFTSYENIHFERVAEGTRQLDQLARSIGDMLEISVIPSALVLEGGAFELNGKGTIILVDSLVLKRNLTLSKDQIENELEERLGVTSIIWLKQGLATDPDGSRYFGNATYANGTGGHTDHFVRFANDSTILLHWEVDSLCTRDTLSRLNHIRMTENLRILENYTDHRGKQFQVVRIPSPGVFYDYKPIGKALKKGLPELWDQEGNTIRTALCSTYLNFLITNGLVILPAYGVKTDMQVRTIFQNLYPHREIFQINPSIYNRMSGGIHCLTFHQPAFKPMKAVLPAN